MVFPPVTFSWLTFPSPEEPNFRGLRNDLFSSRRCLQSFCFLFVSPAAFCAAGKTLLTAPCLFSPPPPHSTNFIIVAVPVLYQKSCPLDLVFVITLVIVITPRGGFPPQSNLKTLPLTTFFFVKVASFPMFGVASLYFLSLFPSSIHSSFSFPFRQ